MVAWAGFLDPDDRLFSSFERFPEVSPPGGGTRIAGSGGPGGYLQCTHLSFSSWESRWDSEQSFHLHRSRRPPLDYQRSLRVGDAGIFPVLPLLLALASLW